MHKRRLAAVCCCIAILTGTINVGAVETDNGEVFANQQSEIVVEKELLTEEDCSNGESPKTQESDKNEETIEEENEEKSEEKEENKENEENAEAENEEAVENTKLSENITESELKTAELTVTEKAAVSSTAAASEVFSMNVENISQSNGVSKKGSSTANSRTDTATGKKYIEFSNMSSSKGTIAQASPKLTSDGYIDFGVRLKELGDNAELKLMCGSNDTLLSFAKESKKWEISEDETLENDGGWMEFRVLLRKNDEGKFEKKILLKNSAGAYEELTTVWEQTELTEIKMARITGGYMTIDICRFAATAESIAAVYPTVSVQKIGDNTAEIIFSRKMSAECMNRDMIKIKGNTVTDFSYDEENNKITITTEKAIATDEIMFRSGMRADNDMPLMERISTSSLNVTGASIKSGDVIPLRAGKIEITVSQELDPNTVNKKNVTMPGTENYEVSYDSAKRKIVISYGKLTAGAYNITVGKGVLSTDGDFLMKEYTLAFEAVQPKMEVKSASITNGEKVSMATGELTIEFSTKPDVETLTEENIKLTKSNGTPIRGIYTINANVAENKLIIRYGALEPSTQYKLSINNVSDIDGGVLSGYNLSFGTEAESIYDYAISTGSENDNKTHKYMDDEETPYMRLSTVKYYSNVLKETAVCDLDLRVDKAFSHTLQLANYRMPGGNNGTWFGVYAVNSNGWSFTGSNEKYQNNGDWTKIRIIMDKDGRETYLFTYYMMNKNGVYEKVSQVQTNMTDFDYSAYGVGENNYVDCRSMSYRRFGNGYLLPEILKTDYLTDKVKVYFSTDMNAESFDGAVIAKNSAGEQIESVTAVYDEETRCLTVNAEGAASIVFGEGVKSKEAMPLGDISKSLEKNDFSVSNITLTDGVGGNSISSLSGVNTVSGTALVENRTEESTDVTLFTVMFDKNGMIKKMTHRNKTVGAGKSTYIYDASLENINAEQGDYVKVFLWKSNSPNTKPAPTADFVKIDY